MLKQAYYIDLLEQNLYDLYMTIASIHQFKKGKIQENLHWVLPENEPFPNFIFGDADEKSIVEITNGIEQDILPKFWLSKNLSTDKSNEKLIEFYGFRKILAWYGMYLEVKNHKIKRRKQVDFELLKDKDLKEAVDLINAYNFGKANASYAYFKELLKFEDVFNMYVIKVQKEIACACLSFRKNGRAGFFMMATKKEFRRKGIASAMIQNMVDAQKRLKTKYITLQPNQYSKIIFDALNFKTVCSFDIYGFIGT